MITTPYLFAYGFLMSDFHDNELTQTPALDAQLVGSGTYSGQLYRVASYPGVTFDPDNKHKVYGEVWQLNHPDSTLPILDAYEHASPTIAVDPEYTRRLRPVKVNNEILECWVYEYLGSIDARTLIKSGRFEWINE